MSELVITDVTLFDGTGAPPRRPVSVLVRDGRIAEIADRGIDSPAARVLSGTGRFLVPGLWDTHVHLVHGSGGWFYPDENTLEQAEVNLRAHLSNGVTTVLDTGGPEPGLVELRARVRSGQLPGPHMLITGRSFTAPGGHPASTIWGGDYDHSVTMESTNAADVTSEVRRLATEVEVDAVKVHYTGGLGPWPELPRIQDGVVRELTREAHRHGLPVIVHVDHPKDAVRALELGIDGLEHMFIPDQGADLQSDIDAVLAAVVQHGACWTPTLVVFEAWGAADDPSYLDRFDTEGSVQPRILKSLRAPGNMWASLGGTPVQAEFRARREAGAIALPRAHAQGVLMAVGTDAGASATFHGMAVHREMQIMVEAGIAPSDALLSATGLAARKLGLAEEVGTIVVGRRADLLLLDADPLSDISNTRAISAVIKAGEVLNVPSLAVS